MSVIIKPVPAVAYCRLSREDAYTGSQGLQIQRSRIQEFATAHRFRIAPEHWFEENGVTGNSLISSRKEGKRMLDVLYGGGHSITKSKPGQTTNPETPRIIIAFKMDRLFRNVAEALTRVDEWDKAGIGTILLDFNGTPIDTRTAAGRMHFTIMAGAAEFERNRTKERVIENIAWRRKTGQAYSEEIFGYANIDGRILALPEEQEVIRWMQELRKKGYSLRRIAHALGERGVSTKDGKERWHHQVVARVLRRAEQNLIHSSGTVERPAASLASAAQGA